MHRKGSIALQRYLLLGLVSWLFGTTGAKCRNTTVACSPESFSPPSVFGVEVLSITAEQHESADSSSTTSFCEVTVSYTHPGYSDKVNVRISLPLDHWNERFLGLGGGGYVAANTGDITPAVNEGYAAATTDAGIPGTDAFSARTWALKSPGNINWPILYNFAYISLGDLADIGKEITKQYYGRYSRYSYWKGCSTGGRQGHMLSQRFPEAFDGILAAAPAINSVDFQIAGYWPYYVMLHSGVVPRQCELSAITTAAVDACDELDGLRDGIVSAPDLCHFDSKTVVGQAIDCKGAQVEISPTAAEVAMAAWEGPRLTDGSKPWFGFSRTTLLGGLSSLVPSDCTPELCTSGALSIFVDWIKLFVKRDPDFDLDSITLKDYERILHQSQQQYDSVIASNSPDLSDFRDHGGKMITWHGLDDQLIFPNGTRKYFLELLDRDEHARDYYRYFEVPGVQHCYGGTGPNPTVDAMRALRAWVEDGIAPEMLVGELPAGGKRLICAYPLVAVYQGRGDPNAEESFYCADSFDAVRQERIRDEL